MKTVMVIGEPGVGKTTLARKVIERLGPGAPFALGKARGTFHAESKVWVLGVYPPGETFGGTDKLSMAVIGDAIDWLKTVPKGHSVFLEGDRLANIRFLQATQLVSELRLFVLRANEAKILERRLARGSQQDPTWLAGRATKVRNLARLFSHVELWNDCRNSDVSEQVVFDALKP